MKQVAPAPVAPMCHNWTGFYIGGFGGYKFNSVDLDTHLAGTWDVIPDDRNFVAARSSGDLDNGGGEAGGLIGYNWQFNCWVVGLEGSGGYLWARDNENTGYDAFGTFFPTKTSSSFETHYLGTFGPRLGYSFGQWLPYITGGLAVGDLEYTQSIQNPPILDPIYRQVGSVHDTNVGWMVGGGLQFAINNHWSVRGQYQYIDLGSVDFSTSSLDSFANPPYTGHHEASLREHNASFAIIYGF